MISPLLIWGRKKSHEEETLELEEKPQERTLENIITNMPKNKPITTETIKELREQTGVSIMQCKKALEEANGDLEKAVVILRKKSGELAAKKSDRVFHSGTVQAYIHSNGTVGAMVELLSESDFVSNTDEFKALARDIAMHVTATNPKFLSREDITEADRKVAAEVFAEEVKGKPEAMKQKILDGKLEAYFGEMVLNDQPFIKNNEVTIKGLIDNASQKFGEKMAIGRFKRFKVLES
ncbi:MAG: elongation factor Ts [Candidatus Paceibacterota bacterium]